MSTVIRFPGGRAEAVAKPIPRAEFERLAELALDIVDQIIALLDDGDGDSDNEESGDAEPDLGAPDGHENQVIWLRGTTRDLELDRQPESGLGNRRDRDPCA